MIFMDLPGELRNKIYPELINEIEGRTLIFTNNPTGLVPGWPATIVPRIPIGLLNAGSKLIRKELLPLAYEKADIHVRIVSAYLKSTSELHAWINDNDAIPFPSLDVALITKLSLTILLPCSFETIHKGQGIDFTWLTRMSKLRKLSVRIQVHVSNPHQPPWDTLHTPVPDTTFTPFVTNTMERLFTHIPQKVEVEFGDGVAKEHEGLGTWVDDRADGRRDQGWMENPVVAREKPESSLLDRDTVAVPCDQAEEVWGKLREQQGTADAFTRLDPVEVDEGVDWGFGSGLGKSVEDPVVVESEDEAEGESDGSSDDSITIDEDEEVESEDVIDLTSDGDTEMPDEDAEMPDTKEKEVL